MAATKYHPERRWAPLTPGEMIRITRELQGFSQSELAKLAGISQPALSALESGAQTLGLERAKKLATILEVHPAALAFPDYEPQKVVKVTVKKRAVRTAAAASKATKDSATRRAG